MKHVMNRALYGTVTTYVISRVGSSRISAGIGPFLELLLLREPKLVLGLLAPTKGGDICMSIWRKPRRPSLQPTRKP